MICWRLGQDHRTGADWLMKGIQGKLSIKEDVTSEVKMLKELYRQADDAGQKVIRAMWLPILDDHPQLGSLESCTI